MPAQIKTTLDNLSTYLDKSQTSLVVPTPVPTRNMACIQEHEPPVHKISVLRAVPQVTQRIMPRPPPHVAARAFETVFVQGAAAAGYTRVCVGRSCVPDAIGAIL